MPKRTKKARINHSLGAKKAGVGKWMLGRKLPEETLKKMRLNGDKSHAWKENPGYRAIHCWVNRWRGTPKECSVCGEDKNRMSWANIDHKYRRVLSDFIRMCPKCHMNYDKVNKLR